MDVGKTLYVKDRSRWRAWLEKNHRSAPEIWLIYYKKASGRPRIPYNDAVDEALCFGWIDSIVKPIDEKRYTQRCAKDVAAALRADRATWKNFRSFPESYVRIRIGWIDAARARPEAFAQRLRYFVKMTAQNKRFGMVQ